MRPWDFQHLVQCDAKEHAATGAREGDMRLFALLDGNRAPVTREDYLRTYQQWVPIRKNRRRNTAYVYLCPHHQEKLAKMKREADKSSSWPKIPGTKTVLGLGIAGLAGMAAYGGRAYMQRHNADLEALRCQECDKNKSEETCAAPCVWYRGTCYGKAHARKYAENYRGVFPGSRKELCTKAGGAWSQPFPTPFIEYGGTCAEQAAAAAAADEDNQDARAEDPDPRQEGPGRCTFDQWIQMDTAQKMSQAAPPQWTLSQGTGGGGPQIFTDGKGSSVAALLNHRIRSAPAATARERLQGLGPLAAASPYMDRIKQLQDVYKNSGMSSAIQSQISGLTEKIRAIPGMERYSLDPRYATGGGVRGGGPAAEPQQEDHAVQAWASPPGRGSGTRSRDAGRAPYGWETTRDEPAPPRRASARVARPVSAPASPAQASIPLPSSPAGMAVSYAGQVDSEYLPQGLGTIWTHDPSSSGKKYVQFGHFKAGEPISALATWELNVNEKKQKWRRVPPNAALFACRTEEPPQAALYVDSCDANQEGGVCCRGHALAEDKGEQIGQYRCRSLRDHGSNPDLTWCRKRDQARQFVGRAGEYLAQARETLSSALPTWGQLNEAYQRQRAPAARPRAFPRERPRERPRTRTTQEDRESDQIAANQLALRRAREDGRYLDDEYKDADELIELTEDVESQNDIEEPSNASLDQEDPTETAARAQQAARRQSMQNDDEPYLDHRALQRQRRKAELQRRREMREARSGSAAAPGPEPPRPAQTTASEAWIHDMQERQRSDAKEMALVNEYDTLAVQQFRAPRSAASQRGHLQHRMDVIADQLRDTYTCENSASFIKKCSTPSMKCCPGKKYLYHNTSPDAAACLPEAWEHSGDYTACADADQGT